MEFTFSTNDTKNESSGLWIFIFNVLFKKKKKENENFQKLNTKKCLNIILHNLFKFNN